MTPRTGSSESPERPLLDDPHGDLREVFEVFIDSLAPHLDTYEQAIYLYALRQTLRSNTPEVVIGFKSARKGIASGVGKKGERMSEGTCYEKLRTLQQKHCLEILPGTSKGTRLRIRLPSDIPIVINARASAPKKPDPDSLDYFADPQSRLLILARENGQCFYCQRVISSNTYVVEHVVSRPQGDNSFRNVVAACQRCNNRKGTSQAEDFLRVLLREERLSDEDFERRLLALRQLRVGELRPPTGVRK